MKIAKIILAVAVVSGIGLIAWKWLVKIPDPSEIRPPTNQFTARVEREIDSMSKAPADNFCKEFYKKIEYHINDYYRQKFLGQSDNDNTQWQEILLKNLYSAYAPKFAEQALYVFSGSEWLPVKLNFIRREVDTLQGSPYLDRGSSVDRSFKNIRAILSKYDEIDGFTQSYNSFSCASEIAVPYPVNGAISKVRKSRAYLSNGLDNRYVNNCTRLKDRLREVPQKLFSKHIACLGSKIRRNSGRYRQYKYQSDYSKEIYTPLKSQLDVLDQDIYGVGETAVNNGYSSLKGLLDADNHNADDYFQSHITH